VSSSRDPKSDYRAQKFGEATPESRARFETDVRFYESPILTLADADSVIRSILARDVTVYLEATKPDPRLRLTVTMGFVPRDDDAGMDLSDAAKFGGTIGQAISQSTVWWSLLEDLGGGPRESEDAYGTSALPVLIFPNETLWGAIWEFDEDCQGARARMSLHQPGCDGRYVARARWVAMEDMSERDWVSARSRMELTRRPQGLIISNLSPV
jgi:hypothetical protein